MDAQVMSVKGGVSVLHKVLQGKHHYEVDHVVRYKNDVTGPFVRKGDKLLSINGQDLENMTPETFAELLSGGSPMLTVHQSSRETPQKKCQEQLGMYPIDKERILLQLSLEMRREEELEEEHQENGGEDRGYPNGKEEHPKGESQSHLGEQDDLLLVSMTRTSISIVKGRGCNAGSPCHDCGGTECKFNDVVMVAESTKVTLEISIYYYKSDCVVGEYLGSPVVLNFTGTDSFLKCNYHNGKAILSIESCEKHKLRHIVSGDKDTWPFVFYMKANKDNSRRFESAKCPGWFMHSKQEIVEMDCPVTVDETFLFIIRKRSTQ